MAAGWLTCLFSYPGVFSFGHGTITYLILLPIALLLVVQSFIADGSLSVIYQNTAAGIALFAVAGAHWLAASPVMSLVGVLVAVATVAIGTLAGEQSVFVLGLLMALISLGNFGLQAFRFHSSYAWAALALIGIGVMFSATLIEKRPIDRILKNRSPWGMFKLR